ncbi:MAG: hypothetical protein GX941_02600 [Candidatus Methanofastidiosa archaeon]|nr:hypothetical protein [Candidatus Methanofastidiosa archaeon]
MSHPVTEQKKPIKLADRYLSIKAKVIKCGFASEIDWQDSLRFSNIHEKDFLREAAWVILSSGMRETIIRQKFPAISSAFLDWNGAHSIVANQQLCQQTALEIFGNRLKIKAILEWASKISKIGFKQIKSLIECEGINFIQTLPFMGPATSYHFAKNIGLDVAKPDRHLVRIAYAAGYSNPSILCTDIARTIGDRVSVIDLVLWRFATIESNYLEYFSFGKK